ncbi:MAG: glutamate-5-semialdehyde dehydrogenase [bacterium]|nr:glutamate-5-semialdehyde dehydrogenase [bacterium]
MTQFQKQLTNAQKAAVSVGQLSHAKRNAAIAAIARDLRVHAKDIMAANSRDLAAFSKTDPMADRLLLNSERIEDMAAELEGLTKLQDPIGQTYDHRTRAGLKLYRKRVPIGVIGVVYESRPNVTSDTAGICLKSGNVVLLKGGKEGRHSYETIVRIIHNALKKTGVDPNAVQLINPTDRSLVKKLITAHGLVDLVIPRGSQQLINFVRANATVPVIETGAGVCHTFVDDSAKLEASAKIIFNAKTQRPSVCNALDTLLVHQHIAKQFLPLVAKLLITKKVELFCDPPSFAILKKHYPTHLLKRARPADFGKEFLSLKMSIKIVSGINAAIEHIAKYSSKHSEAILTQTAAHKKLFTDLVDAAVVYTNASTRFSDGAVFGLGSEIGISTQKLHARGPMGPAELTTYKWIVSGNYTTR